jgi:MoxR-like ATPase
METNQSTTMTTDQFLKFTGDIINEVEKAIIGKREVLQKILAVLLSDGGHVLLEDFPGLGKTLIANSFADSLGLTFKRVQFTPDLMPGDITGGYVFDYKQNEFMLRRGPIFTNILLADEINRASPKTQSALLEAMQEMQVTLEGETERLLPPFIVIATQNPIEYEGTFPLPEAQLDRFSVKLKVGYPTAKEEQDIFKKRLARQEDKITLKEVVTPQQFLEMRQMVENIHVHADVQQYIIDLVNRIRNHHQVVIGVSPRGSLALLKLVRAWAAIQGRAYVTPDDVKGLAKETFCHRIILEPSLWGSKTNAYTLVEEVLQSTQVPVATYAVEQ